MAGDASFAKLIARVQGGDAEAARRLYDEYGANLLRAVRRRMHQRLRTKFDSLDFAQDVWASFFVQNAGRYEITTPVQLANLLATMAQNKVREAIRARLAQKREKASREQSLEAGGRDRLAAVQPTPSQIVMGEEAWDRLLAEQRPVHRRVLLLLRQGQSPAIIAQELGISTKTVQRIIRKVIP